MKLTIQVAPCEIFEYTTPTLIWYLLIPAAKSTQSKGHILQDVTELTDGQAFFIFHGAIWRYRYLWVRMYLNSQMCTFKVAVAFTTCLVLLCYPQKVRNTVLRTTWRTALPAGVAVPQSWQWPRTAVTWSHRLSCFKSCLHCWSVEKVKDATLDMVYCEEIMLNRLDLNPHIEFST